MVNSSRITHCFINTPSSSLFTYTPLQIFKNASCSNFRFFITLEQLVPSDQFFVNCFYTLSKMPQVKEIIVICDPFYQDIFEDAKEHIQVDLKFALPGKERQDSVYSRLQVVGYYQGPPVMPLLQYYTAPPPRRNYGYLEGCLDALFCCWLIDECCCDSSIIFIC